MEITKKQVIEALTTEPILMPGRFFDTIAPGDLGKCPVCAVGSVLRHSLSQKELTRLVAKHGSHGLGAMATRNAYDEAKQIHILLKDENYLGALSSYFEQESSKYDCTRPYSTPTREQLIEFVQKYFPETITIDF